MARITVEDCLDNESNRFALVRLAARRAKQLLAGSTPVTDTKGNRAIVSALREIADGKVKFGVGEDPIQPSIAGPSSGLATGRAEAKSESSPAAGISAASNPIGGPAVGGADSVKVDEAISAATTLS